MIWSINLPMTHTQFLFFLFFATRTILKYFENILELALMFYNDCESLVRENNGYDLETDGFLSRTFSPVVLSTQGIHYCVFLSFLRHEGRVCFLFPYLMSEAIGQCWTESDAKSMFNEWMSKERHYFLIECRKEKDFLFYQLPLFFSVFNYYQGLQVFPWGSGLGLSGNSELLGCPSFLLGGDITCNWRWHLVLTFSQLLVLCECWVVFSEATATKAAKHFWKSPYFWAVGIGRPKPPQTDTVELHVCCKSLCFQSPG